MKCRLFRQSDKPPRIKSGVDLFMDGVGAVLTLALVLGLAVLAGRAVIHLS